MNENIRFSFTTDLETGRSRYPVFMVSYQNGKPEQGEILIYRHHLNDIRIDPVKLKTHGEM